MDYKARFYSPVLNRFIQPDSIVPGLFNPQNLNRFGYVRNNPIKYVDPTGHTIPCTGDRWDDGPQCFGKTRQERLQNLGITIDEDMPNEYTSAIIAAAIDEGGYYATLHGGTAEGAFKEKHEYLNFVYDPNCYNCRNVAACGDQMTGTVGQGKNKISCTPGGAYTDNAHQITIASMSAYADARVINIMHEFGHVHNNLNNGDPEASLSTQEYSTIIANRALILMPNPGYVLWQQNNTPSASETLGDIYVAQIYGIWNDTKTANLDLISKTQIWAQQWIR